MSDNNLLDKKNMEITIINDGKEIETLSFMEDGDYCKGWGKDDFYIAYFDEEDHNRLMIDMHWLNEVFSNSQANGSVNGE